MQRISFEPDPPEANKNVKICYDFDGSGLSSTTIDVSFLQPDSGPTSYPLTPEDNCVSVYCKSAQEILVVDTKGVSDDAKSPIA